MFQMRKTSLISALLLVALLLAIPHTTKAAADEALMSQDWRTALPADLPLSEAETAALTKY